MEFSRQERLLELFFRGLRGEGLSVQALAQEYDVSTKSITRSINDLKAFLAASTISRRFWPITGRWLVMQSFDTPTRAGAITCPWRNFSAIRNYSP